MRISEFTRKTFNVRAVQVTGRNMEEVAKWCKGTIVTEMVEGEAVKFIKVNVHRPINEEQTKAHINDWILVSPTGYKVYNDKAFNNSFVPVRKKPKEKPIAKNVFENLEELRVTNDPVPAEPELREIVQEEPKEPEQTTGEKLGFSRGPNLMKEQP